MQTDMKKLIVGFCYLANTPQKMGKLSVVITKAITVISYLKTIVSNNVQDSLALYVDAIIRESSIYILT